MSDLSTTSKWFRTEERTREREKKKGRKKEGGRGREKEGEGKDREGKMEKQKPKKPSEIKPIQRSFFTEKPNFSDFSRKHGPTLFHNQ